MLKEIDVPYVIQVDTLGALSQPNHSPTFLLGARLVRLFGTSNLAQIILLHFSEFHPLMYDIQDPPAWRNVYDNDGACISWRSTRDFTFPMYRWCQSLPKGQCHLFNVAHCSYDIKSSDVRHLFSNFRLVGIVPGRDGMLVV